MFQHWHEICTHTHTCTHKKSTLTCSMCSVLCMFYAESEKQRRGKDRGSLWGWTGWRDRGVMKKWLKEGCWEEARKERQMVWAKKGEEGFKDPQQAVIEMDWFCRQMIRRNKKTWQVYPANQNCVWVISPWVGVVKLFQGHLLCDIAALRSCC